MDESSQSRTSTRTSAVFGAAALIGVAFASALLATSGTSLPRRQRRKASALPAYLRDHLSGSDAAIQVVERLRHTHAGTDEGRLCSSLFEEFREERTVVHRLLMSLDASSVSLKRLASQTSGALLKFTAGGSRGDLSLFRTLEALAVAVQGKRCMWRALQVMQSSLPDPGTKSFADLEAQAIRQWEAIEQRRASLVSNTFPAPADRRR